MEYEIAVPPANQSQSPLAIANYFIKKAMEEGRHLGITQLVKLVYLAHGWHLGFSGTPLISGEVKAWQYGPVVPEVYYRFRHQGLRIKGRVLDDRGAVMEPRLTADQTRILDKVFDAYSRLPVSKLFSLTHAKGTPWDQTSGLYVTIPNDVIREYYKGLVV